MKNKHFMLLGALCWFVGLFFPVIGTCLDLEIGDASGIALVLMFLAIIIWTFDENKGSPL